MLEMSDLSEKQIASFWAKVRRGAPDECWEWAANRSATGYGKFSVKYPNCRRVRTFKASRLAYCLANGPFDETLSVMHSCDNPPCCNPEHLSLGTHAENMADCARKGRAAIKLTADKIALIRADPRLQRVIANDFGIRQDHVSRIKSGKAWSHV
jgi:hypothetical protein